MEDIYIHDEEIENPSTCQAEELSTHQTVGGVAEDDEFTGKSSYSPPPDHDVDTDSQGEERIYDFMQGGRRWSRAGRDGG